MGRPGEPDDQLTARNRRTGAAGDTPPPAARARAMLVACALAVVAGSLAAAWKQMTAKGVKRIQSTDILST